MDSSIMLGLLIFGGSTTDGQLLYIKLFHQRGDIFFGLTSVAQCMQMGLTRRTSQFWHRKLHQWDVLAKLYYIAGLTLGTLWKTYWD